MTDDRPHLHDLGDGLFAACLSCPEHGMAGWDRWIARSRAKDARITRMHREYARRTRARKARRHG